MNPKDLSTTAPSGIDQDWVAKAKALTPLLDAAAPRIDAAKGLPADVQDALFEAKMFRMLLPRSIGGAELDLPTFFQVIQAIAQGDASAAWSVAQSNACAMSAAYMEPAAAHAVFDDARAVLSWGFPQGPCTATPVTTPVCPCNVSKIRPLVVSNTFTIGWSPATASRVPSKLNTMLTAT